MKQTMGRRNNLDMTYFFRRDKKEYRVAFACVLAAIFFLSMPTQGVLAAYPCYSECEDGLSITRDNLCATEAECRDFCKKDCLPAACATSRCVIPGDGEAGKAASKIPAGKYGLLDPLQGASVPDLIGGFVRFLLGFVGALFFAFFIYGGLLWTLAGGETERVKKAKHTLSRAVVGLAIIFLSYAIVSTLLHFFGQVAVPAAPAAPVVP